MSKCRYCGATIGWHTTRQSKPMPVNPGVITVINETGDIVQGMVPHFVTCPNYKKPEQPKTRSIA